MSDECNQKCGLFDFMAIDMGIRVLHPGGHEATDSLLSCCGLNSESHVLDVACGAGTSAFQMAKRFDCRVTGIDISEELIGKAERMRKERDDKILFEVADAMALPFPDNTFDVVISQAFFVLIDDREKALTEMMRVLKPGGILGALEKSWFQLPPQEVYDELVQNTCSTFIPRVQTFERWESFFSQHASQMAETRKFKMTSGRSHLVKNEGLILFFSIMLKMLTRPSMRRRMMTVQKTFGKHDNYLGYGIYCFQKQYA